MLQSGQKLTTNWLFADGEHSQRQIVERCGGVQLLAAERPTAHLRSLGGREAWQRSARPQLRHLPCRQPGRDAMRDIESAQQPQLAQPAEHPLRDFKNLVHTCRRPAHPLIRM
jgi:hypothetical protein